MKTSRVYFSSFHPVKNTPLEKKLPENRWREYRLYQSSFLLQRYGYHWKDFVFDDSGKLPNRDPKFLMAMKEGIYIDVNEASFEELVKVPGIGVETAKKILINRPIKNSEQLKKTGAQSKSFPFIRLKKEIQTNLRQWN